MPVPTSAPALERLHEFVTQPVANLPSAARVEEGYKGTDLYVNLAGLEIVREGDCTVVRGVLGETTIGNMG